MLNIPEHKDIDTSSVKNLRYDQAPIDIIIWIIVLITCISMIYITIKELT